MTIRLVVVGKVTPTHHRKNKPIEIRFSVKGDSHGVFLGRNLQLERSIK